jgi:hypothetical protein
MRKIAVGSVAPAILLTLAVAATPARSQGMQEKVTREKTAVPTEVDGVPCAAGYVFRDEATGALRQCTLARDAVVHNAGLRQGTTVALTPDGAIRHVFLPGPTMVGEHGCRGKGHGWMTHFHPNGALKSCWLSRDEVIQGVPCARATFLGEFLGRKYAMTEFHENGSLASCLASSAVNLDGRTFAAGDRVKLEADGRPLPAR